MTLATGAVTLISQGNDAGWVLLAVVVFASNGWNDGGSCANDPDGR